MLHQFMVEKLKIAENWLPRYTGTQIDEFGESILLTNFKDYVTAFAEKFDVEVKGKIYDYKSYMEILKND